MKTYKFGNFETEFDSSNVDFVKKYEYAVEGFNSGLRNIPEGVKESESLEKQWNLVTGLFDNIFGTGTSDAMFGGNRSVALAYKAFSLLVDVISDTSDFNDLIKSARKNVTE